MASRNNQDPDQVNDQNLDNDEDDESPTWEVKAVTDMRLCDNGRVMFCVIWESDGSKTWEPEKNFPGGLQHEMIQAFKISHARKYESVMKQAMSGKKPTKKHGWSYEVDSDERYEKPDDAASREARRLMDPNRLEDVDEKFLRTYTEGRTSRSKSAAIKRAINMSSDNSQEQPATPSPPKQEKKERKKGSGRKKKVSNEPTSSNNPNPDVKSDNIKQSPGEQLEKQESSEKAIKEATNAESASGTSKMLEKRSRPGIKSAPTKRGVRLNSSDSSGDEREHTKAKQKFSSKRVNTRPTESPRNIPMQRMEGGTNVIDASSRPVISAASGQGSSMNRVEESIPIDSSSHFPDAKRVKKEEEEMYDEENEDFADSSDGEEREDRAVEEHMRNFGIRYVVPTDDHDVERLTAELESKRLQAQAYSIPEELHNAIMKLDVSKVIEMMYERGPIQSLRDVSVNHSLHEILLKIYSDWQNEGRTAPEQILKDTEKMIRDTFPFICPSILNTPGDEENSLLHCAIYAEHLGVVKFLIDNGASLEVRNQYGMTPVESCLVRKIENVELRNSILDLLLINGGTFHHILERPPIPGTDFYQLHGSIEKGADGYSNDVMAKLNSVNTALSDECRRLRATYNADIWEEVDCGPIVCFPKRYFLDNQVYQRTMQFVIPEHWIEAELDNVMLAVIPMAPRMGRFSGGDKAPKMQYPVVCRTPCEPMTKSENTIFYQASVALKTHFENVRTCGEEAPPNKNSSYTHAEREEFRSRIFHPRVCTISLDIEANETFHFITCQLIRLKIKDPLKSAETYELPSTNGLGQSPKDEFSYSPNDQMPSSSSSQYESYDSPGTENLTPYN